MLNVLVWNTRAEGWKSQTIGTLLYFLRFFNLFPCSEVFIQANSAGIVLCWPWNYTFLDVLTMANPVNNLCPQNLIKNELKSHWKLMFHMPKNVIFHMIKVLLKVFYERKSMHNMLKGRISFYWAMTVLPEWLIYVYYFWMRNVLK